MKLSLNINKSSYTKPIREIGRNPYVDWVIIILICTTGLIAMITYGVILYKKVESGQIITTKVSSDSKLKTFNQDDLQLVIGKFNSKADNTEKIRKSYKVLSDPAR